ncbi:DUF2868 domain-containing protein [Alcaligenaceae bacterium CGII-47]|nr:DUF2868 domain-containing protein [Alcaligenaceae bacterium CGII-47]
MTQPTSLPASTTAPSFQTVWQAEAIRLREAHWGPLEDTAECRRACQPGLDLSARILLRAQLLAARDGLTAHLAHWAWGARLAAVLLWVVAAITGISAAWGALGSGQAPINLALALLTLLGLHSLTFFIWLLSLWPGTLQSSGLSQAWLWLTQRLARGPDAALASQSLLSMLARARAWRPVLGGISHSTWSVALASALLTLLVLLSTRRYAFQWETTLLSPESFIVLAHALGTLPSWLGFPIPDAGTIVASDGLHRLPIAAQADWSAWLIGCVLIWGLMPRVLAGLLCLLIARRRLRQPFMDISLPGWLELRERLMPRHRPAGIDAPAPGPAQPVSYTPPAQLSVTNASVILGMELGPDTNWPPEGMPHKVLDLGICDSRADRQRIVQQMQSLPKRLLLVYDARQTPDRGTRAWIAELQQLCPQIDVLLLNRPAREAIWQDILAGQGIALIPSLADWIRQDAP